jgi:DNA-binding NarL/FixJ family response regulator
MAERIRILVADDHPLFREGVVHSLAAQADFEIVGEAASGEEALKLARDLVPDVVLLDISMPGWGGIVTAEKITIACPAARVMMLTVMEDESKLLAAFKAGARAYVLKGISAHELARVVRSVDQGEVYVTPSLAAGILVALSRSAAPQDPLEELSEREAEILKLVVKGLTNREIGEHLHLSEKTIKHYITNILEKLHVRSRMEAAMLAVRGARHDTDLR